MGGNITKEVLSNMTEHVPGFMSYHCVMIGLDTAGKTTVLYRLKFDQYVSAAPTIGFNCEKIKTKFGSNFMVWDVGGQDKLRPLWRSYTRCTDGIIFVIDSCRPDRLEEAKLELFRMCKGQSIPVLILANKQDLPKALELRSLEKLMGLTEQSNATFPWDMQATCAVTGEGLDEGMRKLHEMILKRRKTSRTNFVMNGKRVEASNDSKNIKTKSSRRVKRSHSHHY